MEGLVQWHSTLILLLWCWHPLSALIPVQAGSLLTQLPVYDLGNQWSMVQVLGPPTASMWEIQREASGSWLVSFYAVFQGHGQGGGLGMEKPRHNILPICNAGTAGRGLVYYIMVV